MQDNTLKYKNEFATKFATLMQTKRQQWKDIQAKAKKRLFNFESMIFYFILCYVGFLPNKNEMTYDLNFHIGTAIFLFIIAFICNIAIKNKEYQKSIKKTLFPELLKIFHQDINYVKAGRESIYWIPNIVFEHCGLYNHNIESRTEDDLFYGYYKDIQFTIDETDFGYMVRNCKGRKQYNRQFKGLAMHFKMNKEIKSKVLIVPKFYFLITPKDYEPVQLEDINFSKKYKVFVKKNTDGENGQIEARYLLNTLFINRFMQLKASFKIEKIACSIVGNDMLIMLSTSKDLFEMNHLFGKIDDTSQYQHLFDEFSSVFSFIDVLNITSKTKL